MALNTVADIIGEVLVRNNRTTTDSFITDTMLEDWIRQANKYCTAFKKWPLSEIRDKTTTWAGTEEVPYSSFGINFKADSIRILQVDGKRVEKIQFEKYQNFREDYPSDNRRVFSDFQRTLFINPNADISGTIAAFGQHQPDLDPTDASATTIFSDFDEEGNEGIVQKMTEFVKEREHLPDEANLYNQKTDITLTKLYEKIQAEQYKYQSGRNSEGMFKRFNITGGGFRDDIWNRDQF